MKKLFSVLHYASGYRANVIGNVLFNLLASVFELFSIAMLIPFLNLIFREDGGQYQNYINHGLPAFAFTADWIGDAFNYYFSLLIVNGGGGKEGALMYLCIAIVIFTLFKNMFRYLALFVMAPLRNGAMRDIRNRMYNKVLSLPLAYFSDERKGDIIARMTNDVQEIEWTIMQSIEMLFKEPVTLVVYLISMVLISPSLTLFVLIMLPLAGLLIGRIGNSLKKTSAAGQSRMGQLVSNIEETLGGLRIIKAFNAQKKRRADFYAMNESYRKLMVKMYRKRDLASPLSEFLAVGVLAVVIWFGGTLVFGAKVSPSALIGFVAIFSRVISPAKALTTAYYNIQKGAASEDRINQILHAKDCISEKKDATQLSVLEDKIVFDDVSFSYEQEPVLAQVSFEIPKGHTVALVGPSGGGKSTIADLLARFYDVDTGSVQMDGHDLRDIGINSLRQLMGIVTQESILFNDTVFNNISFGVQNVSEEDVARAAKIANAHDFINEMPKGFQTIIGDRGLKLSGGQRQRLSIARAVLKNPPILILDEATSALDTESEKLVQEAIVRLMANRTTLVIAHRLSTVVNANTIHVVKDGRIVESGSHDELTAKNGEYKKLYDMQAIG